MHKSSDVSQVLLYLLCWHFFVNLNLLWKASLRKMKMAPESGYPLISYWKNTWKYFVFQSLHANYKPIRIIVSGLIFTKAANIMISLMQCICRYTNADTKICWYILLRKECPYSELFWSVLSPNARKYGPE